MRTIVITCLLILSGLLSYGQITPFRYNTTKNEETKLRPDLNIYKINTQDLDSIKNHAETELKMNPAPTKKDSIKIKAVMILLRNWTKSLVQGDSLYKDISEILSSYATIEEEMVKKKYFDKAKKAVEDFKDANKPDDIDILKTSLQTFDRQRKDELLKCKQVRNLSKEYDYRYRSSGKISPFPVRNSVDGQLFYDSRVNDQTGRFLKNTYLAISTDTIIPSLFTEIFADYWGPFRAGFGLLVSTGTGKKLVDSLGNIIRDTSSVQKNAVQRLINNGGNVSFNISYPLASLLSKDESLGLNLTLVPKLAMDVPYLGTDKKDYSVNGNIGSELTFFYTGALKVMTFYGAGRIGYVVGNNQFYNYINKPDKKAFFFNQLTLGCAINSTFRVAWNYFWGSGFVMEHFPSTISLSIVPN